MTDEQRTLSDGKSSHGLRIIYWKDIICIVESELKISSPFHKNSYDKKLS